MELKNCFAWAVLAALGTLVAHADFTVGENLSLTQDLEWQYRGKMTIADGVTIDLNGHALHVGEMAGNGIITNSAAGAPAALHVFVPYEHTNGNATVSIGGNLRLFKDGLGTFAPTKTGQTYTGGTEVTAGTMKAWSCHYPIKDLPANSPGLFLDAGATFDMDGLAASNRSGNLGDGHWYNFCGGTFVNNGNDVSTGWSQLDHVRLTADSTLSVPLSYGLIGTSYSKTDLDLQGHTLSVALVANKYFYLWNTDVTVGTLRLLSGGYLDIDKTSVRAENATLDLNAALNIKVNATFGTLISRYSFNAGGGGATLFVKKRFKPVGNYIYNFQLQSGATIDLTERTDTYSFKSSINSKVLGFAANAAITVDISGRVLEDGARIVSWDTAPNATFTLDAESARAYTLNRDAGGLTVTPRTDIAARATWIGAGDAADPTDPANWSCTDPAGNPVAGYPCILTTIDLGGTTAMGVPAGTRLFCREIVASGTATLAADCDWRGLVKPAIACALDLAGHKLLLSDIRGEGTITDSTADDTAPGELHVDVPAGETAQNTSLSITGHVKLVKDGLGTFAPTKNPQTDYTGGTVIEAGLFKARVNRYSTKSELVVRAGARFDYDPYHSGNVWELGIGPFVLDGGDLFQNWSEVDDNWGQFSKMVLTADSSFTSNYRCGLIGGNFSATTLDLGGHTLYANFGSSTWKFFQLFNVTATKGTIRVGPMTSLYFNKTSFRGPEVTLDIDGFMEPYVPVAVSNVIVRTISSRSWGGSTITISGTFTPISDWLHNFQLQNGATLDLNRRFDPFPLTSPLTGKTLAFAANASVTVDVHARTFAAGECLVTWAARPAGVTFVLDPATAATGKTLEVNDVGIFLICPDDIANAYWTDAEGDHDLANAGNWACTNGLGQAVVGGLPQAVTRVHFNGALDFPTLDNDSLRGAFIMIEDATLAADADWTAVDNRLSVTGLLDLQGHTLRLSRFAGSGTITDTSTDTGVPGEVHIVVPANETVGNSSTALTGNLKLVKEGEGSFLPTKTDQTYTGGTEIAGGLFKAWTCHYPNADGITVDEGAVYDFDGANASNRGGYIMGWLVLNGGTMACQTSDVSWGSIPHVRLLADSTLRSVYNWNILGNAYSEASLDLGEKTLTVDIAANKSFSVYNCTATAGVVKSTGAGQLVFTSYASRFNSASLDLGTSIGLNSDVTVKNLTVNYTGTGKSGAKTLSVEGVYTPNTDYIYNFLLKTGSTINLREKTAPWPLTSQTTSQTLAFASDAVVTIDLAGRTFDKEPTLVLDWGESAPADVTFVLDAESQRQYYLTEKTDGLYAAKRGPMVIIFR